MSANKILPLSTPYIQCVPNDAFFLAVAQNLDTENKWFFNNFVQLAVRKHDNEITIRFRGSLLYYNCPFIHMNRMDLNFFLMKYESEVSLLKDLIINNYYVITYLDRNLIDKKTFPEYFPHAVLVYGFDDSQKKMHIADFLTDARFTQATISYDNYFLARENIYKNTDLNKKKYLKRIKRFSELRVLKTKSLNYDFDLEYVKKLLNDYLNGVNTVGDYMEQKRKKYVDYGINANDILMIFFDKIKKNEPFDLISFAVIRYHKSVMLSRLDFLEKYGYLNEPELNKKNYRELLAVSDELINYILKYLLTKNKKYIDEIHSRIVLIQKNDKNAAEVLLNSLG